jgi:hypothetical protein
MLPELIAEASRLPLPSFGDHENEEQEASINKIHAETEMKQQEWGQLYDSLKEKLGDWDLYWMVFDPRTDNEAIHGSLADDIADIYRDLKDGIGLKETNKVPGLRNHLRMALRIHFSLGPARVTRIADNSLPAARNTLSLD